MNTAAPPQSLNALLALGQSRRPWDYLRAVAEAEPDIAVAPPVRFLLAANLGSLGFPDAALDLLDELDAQSIAGLNTDALRTPLRSKPRTALDPEQLTQTLRHNATLLNIPDLRPIDSPVWIAPNGAVLWREGSTFNGCDAVSHAASAIEQAGLSPDRIPADHLPPQLIAGLSTPHLLRTLLRATPPLTNGYTPRIFVVEPDTERVARALSMLRLDDLTGTPTGERITLFTGEDALNRLRVTLAASLDCALPRSVLLDPLTPTELADRARQLLTDLGDTQRAAIDRELARIERETQTLEQAAVRVKASTNLRVLIPVSRYTNFVQHSAADLAAALRSLGHEPTILAEPAPHTLLSRLGYLRAWTIANPDLVLSINHPRWRTSSALPERAPSICWVQDAMPHLFEDAAAKQGRYDFIVGYRFHELTERFGYRADRVIDAVLPVSTEKFHDGPVDPDLEKRFTCDVAFATRHSETPEAMVARLKADMPEGTPARAVVTQVYESLRDLIHRGEATFTLAQFTKTASDALEASATTDPKAVDEVIRLIAMPLADRLIRHRVIEWTAEICAEQGWSLALYGSGWDTHPTLAPHARGELLHGEELRAAYRCAGVHLGVSAHSFIHQRVIECLFSGGRVLCYRRFADLVDARFRLFGRLASAAPSRHDERGDPVYEAANHPGVREHLDRFDRFGHDEPRRCDEAISLDRRFLEHFKRFPMTNDLAYEAVAANLLDHHSFADRDELQAMLDQALSRSAESDQEMRALRSAAQEYWSTTGNLRRVLQAVGAAIGSSS